jgi:hypothetical protein
MLYCTWADINTFGPWNEENPAGWPGKVEQLGGRFASPPVGSH